MNNNRFAKTVAVAAGLIFLWVAPGLTRAQSASPRSVQISKVAPTGAQANRDSLPPDDFAGLSYTDEQKAEIEKIRLDTKSRKAVAAKDEKLTADQKDAMLLGYTRMEYGRIYKVLSPEQQRQVRQRIHARRAADEAAKKKQPSQLIK
jgi:Spy/CpxP family protein refolding chaperone